MEEHTTKRIKLSLEPFINKTVSDVTDTGHEIYKSDLSLPEQLMRNVDRVWYERGDWTDITEEGLQHQLEINDLNEDTTATTDATTTTSLVENYKPQQNAQNETTNNVKHDQEESTVDLGKLRESVISKLYFAKCEIDVALDVMNILSTENKRNSNALGGGGGGTGGILAGINGAAGGLSSILGGGLGGNDGGVDGSNNTILPPGTLHATYVSKPKPMEKVQLEQTQLTLGLKRMQQKTAADYLKKSAASLKTMVEEEQQFWDQAVRVRSNHWLMQASGNTSGLWVSYGFMDVGSDFPEACHGEMLRPDQDGGMDGKNQVRLSLPHNIPKQVRVTVKRNQIQQRNDQSRRTFGLEDEEKEETGAQGIYPSMHNQQDDSIQRRLIDAQSTVYDAELFSRILSEAQIIPSNIRCEEDCVIVTLDGEIDIVIQRIQYDHQQQHQQHTNDSSIPLSLQQMVGRTIETALRLLLVQRHRFNLWKPRTRLMAGQRKIQLLLDSIEDTKPSTGSGTKTAGNLPLHGAGSNLNSSNTPKLGPRTTSSASMSGGTSSPSLSSFTLSRQSPSSESHQLHPTREPTSNVPLLAPVISMTRFWILFDRIRDVVHNIVNPLCGETGLGLAVHFKSQHAFKYDHQAYCDTYPSFGEFSTSLAINMFKGPSLRFSMNQTGTITAILPGNTVTLSNVTEFEAFLLREIKLICLHLVCDIANDLIQRSSVYKNAKGNSREAYVWQVDEVEEILYGAVNTESTKNQSSNWKNIQIQLNKTIVKQSMPAYMLQIQEDVLPPTTTAMPNNHGQHQPKLSPPIKHYILLSQWNGATVDGDNNDLGFRDKVAMMVEQLLV